MHETIYNIPGSQGEMMEGNCEDNPGHDMEKKFVKATTYEILEALEVNYNDRRLVEPLLRKQLDNKLNIRWKREGLLQQYESYVLELAGERIKKELGIPDDVKINHSHATHAKYADWVDYLKAEDKEEWLKKFRSEKK